MAKKFTQLPAAQNLTSSDIIAVVNGGESKKATLDQVGTFVADSLTYVSDVIGSAPITSSGGATPTISISAATNLAAGSMSAADKTKLDGIAAGASVASVGGTAPITSTGGTAPTIGINAATTLAAGSMSAADKSKLDGIAAGASIAGTIAATEVAFGTASNTIGGNAGFTFASGTLEVNSGGAYGARFFGQVGINDIGSGAEIVEFEPSLFSFNIRTDASLDPGPGYLTTVEAGQVTILDTTDSTHSTTTAGSNLGASYLTFTDVAGGNVATITAQDGASNPFPLNLVIEELQVNSNPGNAGEVLTSNGPNFAPTWTTPAAAGITALTGDVTASGSGSVAATVAKIQGYEVATTAPTSNQILQWISGTSKWTPTANGVGLGSKVLLCVEGGAYATIQAAIDAASDWDVILVGPKAAGASWGAAVLPVNKRLSIISLASKWSTAVRVDSITYAVGSGTLLPNTIFVKGLFINSSFTAVAPGVNFSGSSPGRLRLQECYIYNNNAATGTGVISNNSNAASSLYIDNCIIQSGASTGIGVHHKQGYTIIRSDTEISRYQYQLQCDAGNVEILNALLDGSGAANEVIRITGGTVTCGYSTIKNTTTDSSGVNIAAAGAVFGMGDATFAIATSSTPTSGYCVTGVAGAVFLYGRITYSNSTAGAYNVKVKNTFAATTFATTLAFTSSP